MEEVIKTSLWCVFIYFLINQAPIFSILRKYVFSYLDINGGRKNVFGWINRKFRYMLGCIVCVTAWYCIFFDRENFFYSPILAAIINSLFQNSFFKKPIV